MKPFIFITVFCLTFLFSKAQSELIPGRTWKVAESTTVFRNTRIVHFHKDSLTNALDYSKLVFRFDSSNTYEAANTNDTAEILGTWRLTDRGDSVVIDGTSFLLVKLSVDSFVTRGYALQTADITASTDSAFNYLRLYAVNSITGPLPVTLTSFTGKFVQNNVQLIWSSAMEVNNKQFDIQASHEGQRFEWIGTVPGAVNSNSLQTYTFNDVRFFKRGKNYYRLKQVDLDGNGTFSDVVLVNVGADEKLVMSIHPNPSKNRMVLETNQPTGATLQISLADVTGRKLWSKILPGNANRIPVDLPQLASGTYIITVVNNKGKKLFTDKLVIQ